MNRHSTAAKIPGDAIGRRPPESRPVARSGRGFFLAIGGCGIAGLAALLVATVSMQATARPDVAEAAATTPSQLIASQAERHAKTSRLRVASPPQRIPAAKHTAATKHSLPEPVRIAAKPAIAPFSMSEPSVRQLSAFSPPAPAAPSLPQFAQVPVARPAPVLMASIERAPVAVAGASVTPASVQLAALPEQAEAEVDAPRSAAAAVMQAIDNVPLPAARPDRPASNPLVARDRGRNRALPSANVLAYARPDAGNEDEEDVFDARPAPAPSLGRGVAIYDITAATVYMPNGEKLEAHSGLGKMKDDPSQAHQRMRGPTPPHTYTLAMRESRFHGVEAIRLHPVGGQKKIHNRDGLLAHTYMLGKGGDSNGCVSFKDYKRFLAAFKRGEVKSLVVVASLPRSSRLARPKSLLSSLFKKS